MYFYEGLTCPVCHKAFQNNEDVVACPECGLPHHRACWLEVGHCQMADKHGTDEQWSRSRTKPLDEPVRQAVDDAANQNICPNCHTRNDEYAEFCAHCGNRLKVTEWHSEPPHPVGEFTPFQSAHGAGEMFSDTEQIGTATARELAAVVGNNSGYYIPQFRRLDTAKGCKWNWAAFFFGPFWLFFRKQYFAGSCFLLLQILYDIFGGYWSFPLMQATTPEQLETAMAAVTASRLMLPLLIFSAVLGIVHILLGCRGNALYKYHCEKKIQKCRAVTADISAFELSSVGGTSVWAVTIAYFVSNMLANAALLFFVS